MGEIIINCFTFSEGKSMVKHVVIWQFKDYLNATEVERIKKEVKERLERMECEGLVKLDVHIAPLETSNSDMMLEAEFTDEASLSRYASYPPHAEVAKTLIIPNVKSRICMDFEE